MCARALLLLYMVIAVRRKAEALSLIGRGGFRRVAVSGTGAMEGERARESKQEGGRSTGCGDIRVDVAAG